MTDFNALNPPKRITDPDNLVKGRQEWPKHVHRGRHAYSGGGEFLPVQNEKELAAALRDGWSLQPECGPESEVQPALVSAGRGKR